jgi:ABC-type transport system involved in multi-copper enzyme maturation permease subunit
VMLPLVLAVTGSQLPPAPPVDAGFLAILVLADLVISMLLVSFAAMATLLVRSGSLTLVVALAYVGIEGALLALLVRFEVFQDEGSLHWVVNLFPFRAIITVLDKLTAAAGRVEPYPGAFGTPDPSGAWLPLAALAVWAVIFGAIAFRRFTRMDIVE